MLRKENALRNKTAKWRRSRGSNKKGPRNACTRGKTSPKSFHARGQHVVLGEKSRSPARSLHPHPPPPPRRQGDPLEESFLNDLGGKMRPDEIHPSLLPTWLFPFFSLVYLTWYFYRVSYCTVAAAVPRTAASCFTPTWRRPPYKGTSYLPVAPVRSL